MVPLPENGILALSFLPCYKLLVPFPTELQVADFLAILCQDTFHLNEEDTCFEIGCLTLPGLMGS